MATITVYRNNELAGTEERDPDELAADFMATLRGEKNPGYVSSRRLNLEFEYRWFLSGKPFYLTWDDEDWPKIWQALWDRLNLLDEDEYSAFIRLLG